MKVVPDCECLRAVLAEPLSQLGRELLLQSEIEMTNEFCSMTAEVHWCDYDPIELANGKSESRFVMMRNNFCPQCGKQYKESNNGSGNI